jgi:hypothetical protein
MEAESNHGGVVVLTLRRQSFYLDELFGGNSKSGESVGGIQEGRRSIGSAVCVSRTCWTMPSNSLLQKET